MEVIQYRMIKVRKEAVMLITRKDFEGIQKDFKSSDVAAVEYDLMRE